MTLDNKTKLAFEIINKGNVRECKFAPNGPAAEAVFKFMGRIPKHEMWINQEQFNKLHQPGWIITHGTGEQRFAGYVRSVWFAQKNQYFYLLVFAGYVPPETPETPEEERSLEKASDFAVVLIKRAIELGRVGPDEYAPAGSEPYFATWLSKAQADSLTAKLPLDAIKQDGSFLTQAVGAYCFWGKTTAKGTMLLCWMGEVPQTNTEDEPVSNSIPADEDLPF